MKLGIGLPNTMANETDRRLMLDWARRLSGMDGALRSASAL